MTKICSDCKKILKKYFENSFKDAYEENANNSEPSIDGAISEAFVVQLEFIWNDLIDSNPPNADYFLKNKN